MPKGIAEPPTIPLFRLHGPRMLPSPSISIQTPVNLLRLTSTVSKRPLITWNNANGSNSSHVTLNVTFSSTVLVTANSSGQVTSAASGNVYQVNKDSTGTGALGVGATTCQGTSSRSNALSNIHPNVTNCEALTQTMAHEIGHTFGLGECTGCNNVEAIRNDRKKMRGHRC